MSDRYIANGSEPWRFPSEEYLTDIEVNFLQEANGPDKKVLPYKRDENFVRPWIKAGTKGLEHRIGGLEKENETGNVSYEAKNHELMTKLREEKIKRIQNFIPAAKVDNGNEIGKLLVLGWGSTYGAIKTAVKECIDEGFDVSHIHLRYINPLPKNLGWLLYRFEKVLIPEMNSGQLLQLIRGEFLIPATGFSKVQGQPFTTSEIKGKIIRMS